ncbi:PAS domain S-box protein [Lutibacter holmesii]|uniref:PAS domain S-box protein n=1 Tax=Lutibacter holmesii TaxID=1137985 RepID=A0ABW3WPT2_9FLAO
MSNFCSLSQKQLNRLFPFFILINKEMEVVSYGESIAKLYDFGQVKKFHEFFKIPRPLTIINSFNDLIELEDNLIVLEAVTTEKLKLRGQFEYLKGSENILFIGSPWFGTIEQLKENNLIIDDFAKHDPIIDLLNVLKSQEITNDELKGLVKTIVKQKNDLKKANKEVYDIALFPQQNPDPNIRINYEGDLIQNNPAASNLDFIEYNGDVYRNDLFFKFLVTDIDKTAKRWNFEARSNDVDYSFGCVSMPEEGYINIYGRDITEQKKNQAELEKLSLIVQETTNAVIITDSKGKLEWVNKAFERITGYKLSEVKGETPGKFLQGEETDPESVSYMREQIKKSLPFTCEVYNYKKCGEGYWLRINGQPIFDNKGKVTHFFALEEDITAEKEAQEKIKAAASRMSSLIANLSDGVLLENKNETVALANKRYCELFNIGTDPAQLIGEDCSNLDNKFKHLFVDPDLFVSRVSELLKNKELVTGEQLELADGRVFERDFVPIWSDGVYDGHLWMYNDVTEKIAIDKKLENLRVFYERILDNIPSDIAVFDKNHRYLYINPTGMQDEELRKWIIGKNDADYIKRRNKPAYILEGRQKAFKEILESKKLKSWEEEIPQEDGTSRFMMRNMYPVISDTNEVDLVIGYGVDITYIKNIQKEMAKSEKRYRDVIDNSLAIITTHDMEGNFMSVNPMVKKLYGYEDDEVIGHSLMEFMPDEDKLLFQENYLNKIKENKEATGIFRVLHKDGSIVYSFYNNFLKEEKGEEPYAIGFAVDITSRILVEKELKIAKKVTEELAQTKQNFLANMSHEIRTPMNAIMGMSRQLQKSTLNDKQRSYLETISSASENLLVIINDVLDLAKLEAGKLTFEKIGFDPKLVIDGAIKVMMHKAEEKGLSLTNSYYDSKLSSVLLGDPFRINQILLNLISNAIKFTAVGGVDICFKVVEDYKTSQDVEIEITDTGIGMEPIFLEHLFKKFSQEYVSVAKNHGGTGLGMSITKSLVDVMEGDILVESEKGKGTTVFLRFNLEKGGEQDIQKKDASFVDKNVLTNKKILVVDDNQMNRMVAALILSEYDVSVYEVENGEEAVKFVKENPCDLVLMDLQMPVLNGYEATKVIREDLNSNIPIIALTANAIKGESEKCLSLGMNDYLSKPFDEDQFLYVVSTWLGKSKNKPQTSSVEKKVPTEALFDLSKLEAIAKGNKAFIDKMLQLFIDDTPASINEMKQAYQSGDFKEVARIAHKIKPSLDTLGVHLLKEEIREIEADAETYGDSEELSAMILYLENTIKRVLVELQKLKSKSV